MIPVQIETGEMHDGEPVFGWVWSEAPAVAMASTAPVTDERTKENDQ